jgi:hypothetical protein
MAVHKFSCMIYKNLVTKTSENGRKKFLQNLQLGKYIVVYV